jgi:hypothetical protein
LAFLSKLFNSKPQVAPKPNWTSVEDQIEADSGYYADKHYSTVKSKIAELEKLRSETNVTNGPQSINYLSERIEALKQVYTARKGKLKANEDAFKAKELKFEEERLQAVKTAHELSKKF